MLSGSKRGMDLLVSLPVVVASLPLVLILVLLATLDTRQTGLFRQERVGKGGLVFTVYKVRTMRPSADSSPITVGGDVRVTRLGRLLRSLKLDELPQFWNVLRGEMSLVGPRPDVAGYADELVGEDAVILALRPGITGLATLVFRNEEAMLALVDDPMKYNDEVIWANKVALNTAYAHRATIADDLELLRLTVRPKPDAVMSMAQRWIPDLVSRVDLAQLDVAPGHG